MRKQHYISLLNIHYANCDIRGQNKKNQILQQSIGAQKNKITYVTVLKVPHNSIKMFVS